MTLVNNARKKLTVFASALTLGLSAALAATPAAAQDTVTWKVQSHWLVPAAHTQTALAGSNGFWKSALMAV